MTTNIYSGAEFLFCFEGYLIYYRKLHKNNIIMNLITSINEI